MGIVNVTPDSFSDGGVHFDPRAAFVAAWAMSAAGADLIDVGGESTRPGSGEVSPAEELARVLPVVRDLAARGAVVSVDTRHATVAAECVRAGAAVINDISGFSDPAMVTLAASCDAGLVVMHMQGDPGTMQDEPHYGDVVAEVSAYLLGQAASLESAGVARERIALDPGIGFGKTTAHNLELLRRLDEIVALGYPVLVGASRKRFIGEITGVTEPRDRLAGSVAAALVAVEHGAAIVRVHDVAETVQALAIAQAVRGGTEER
jgi:dihydropteroate synthase